QAFRELRLGRSAKGFHRLADDRGAQAAVGIGHDQPFDSAGVREREVEAGPTAHGLRDKDRSFDLECVEEAAQVVDEGGGVAPVEVARLAEAAMVEGDAAIAFAEVWHLLPPRYVV